MFFTWLCAKEDDMYRVCQTKDGKFIEMQSGGRIERLSKEDFSTDELYEEYLEKCDDLENMRLNTLTQNAINIGYKEKDIETKFVTDEEWAVIERELNKPTLEQIAERKKEVLIQTKIRELAINALIKEGKLRS
jgi:hypothetical protein